MTSFYHSIDEAAGASTEDSPGKVRAHAAQVFYDKDCGSCRYLAQLMSKSVAGKSIDFLPSPDPHPQQLVVRAEEVYYAGREAWAWLVDHHPLFREWNWLAAKIGLRDETSQLVMRGAEVLRRLCPKCRRR